MLNASDLVKKAEKTRSPKGVTLKVPPIPKPRAELTRGSALRDVMTRHERAARLNIRGSASS